MKKHVIIAVFLGILLSVATFAMPPPVLAHHHPVAHVHNLTDSVPVAFAVVLPDVSLASFVPDLARASPVYAVFLRPRAEGLQGGERNLFFACLRPVPILLADSCSDSIGTYLARASPFRIIVASVDILPPRSPPISVWA